MQTRNVQICCVYFGTEHAMLRQARRGGGVSTLASRLRRAGRGGKRCRRSAEGGRQAPRRAAGAGAGLPWGAEEARLWAKGSVQIKSPLLTSYQ